MIEIIVEDTSVASVDMNPTGKPKMKNSRGLYES